MSRYHPFKMLGSYIGIVFGFVITYFILIAFSVLGEFNALKPSSLLIAFAPLVFGFLLGWGLHSLIRTRGRRRWD